MNDHSTEQLQSILANADNTLSAIVQSLEESSAIQGTVKSLMQAGGRELDEFERLIAGDRALATQVLVSAVGALANLQATRAVKAELKRRVERN